MRVLIIEQNCEYGHYLNWVQYLVRAFEPLGCEIVVAVPKAAPESPPFKMYMSPHQSRFRLEFIPSREYATSMWTMMRTDAHVFRQLIDRVKPDAVYFPTADGVALSLALSRLALLRSGLSPIHSEAHLVRVPAAYGMSRRPQVFTKMVLRAMPFDVVHYIDPVTFDWVVRYVGGKAERRARFMADPIEPLSLPTRSEARAMLGLPEHKRLIMSIGLQDHRKGVDHLLAAGARWHPAEPASIVLAGMLSAPIRELVTNEYRRLVDEGRLVVLDRYLSKEDFNACFAAGDLVATPYRPHPHPSAIVLHAATAGKMVLAANNGWFAYMVPRFSLGRLCDPQDSETFAETLDAALDEAEAYELSAAANRLVEFHHSENCVVQWRRELSKLMGKSEQAPLRDWNWVLNGEEEEEEASHSS
jgi:glycosyltransferase involved in cell wall biosynthesis